MGKGFPRWAILNVTVNVTLSRWVTALGGVPQGSVLASVLFLFYQKDLLSLLSSVLLHADDVKK